MGIARLLKPSRLINLGLVLVPIQKVFVGSGGSTFSDLRSLCLVGFGGLKGFRAVGCYHRLVAEWIHFTRFGAISPL